MQSYIVLEITRNAQGNIAVYPSAKELQSSAEKKYYEILERAVDSNSPLHGAVLMSAEGFFLQSKCYNHDAQPEVSDGE